MRKKASVRKTYYRSFLMLIVLPLVVVMALGSAVLYQKLLRDAREKVLLQQDGVAETLTQEIRSASLQLAHFLLSNDSLVTRLVQSPPANSQQRNEITQQLGEMFNNYRLTGRRLAAMHLYFTDGTDYQLYNDLALPRSAIAAQDWYQKALAKQDKVFVGTAPEGTLLRAKNKRGKVLLAAAMSVKPLGAQTTALEAACLYFETNAENLMADYQGDSAATRMFLLEQGAVLVGDESLAAQAQAFYAQPESPHGDRDWCVVTDIPNTALSIVTIVDNALLMRGYYRVILLCLCAAAVVLALYIVFSVWFLKRILLPLDGLAQGMHRLQQGDFSHRLVPEGHFELQQLMGIYNETGARMERLIAENTRREAEKYEEEIKALQSEINPHFLLNTVNTLRYMAEMAHFDSLRDMAADLMEILRSVLRSDPAQYTLANEQRLLEAYLRIMDIRYCNSFTVHWDFDAQALACRLPKLLLQPLVENAVFHGLAQQEDGVLTLCARVEGGSLVIAVQDNGAGMTQQQLAALLQGSGGETREQHIGLANVQRRIHLQYGEGYGLRAESAPGGGTRITTVLPAQNREEAQCSEQ